MKTSYFTRELPIAFILAPPTLLAQVSTPQTVVLTDDMRFTNYFEFVFNGANGGSPISNPDDISSATWQDVSEGGNPDWVLEVFHQHDVDRDEDTGQALGGTDTYLRSVFINTRLPYTPASQGTIGSVSFSLDINFTDPFETAFFFARQSGNGSVAQGRTGLGILDITPSDEGNPQWQNITLTGLTEADFINIDFSSNAPIEFGFGFESFADVPEIQLEEGDEPDELEDVPGTNFLRADNFEITIVPVPEPSSTLLCALGIVGLARRRR